VTTLQTIRQQPDSTKFRSLYTDIQQDLDMVSLLIPFVALLAVVKATNFKEDVKIDFRLRETPGHPAKFIDSTQYASAESKARLSKQGDKMTDIVGQLVFTRTEESREIKWSGTGDDGKLVQKRVSLMDPS